MAEECLNVWHCDGPIHPNGHNRSYRSTDGAAGKLEAGSGLGVQLATCSFVALLRKWLPKIGQ